MGLIDTLSLDRHGHLADREDWNRDVAAALAQRDGVSLTDPHWEVIDFARDYYARFNMAPPMRVLVKAMRQKLGDDKGNSRYLYRLFSESPARQACCYGGLPKPVGCI